VSQQAPSVSTGSVTTGTLCFYRQCHNRHPLFLSAVSQQAPSGPVFLLYKEAATNRFIFVQQKSITDTQ